MRAATSATAMRAANNRGKTRKAGRARTIYGAAETFRANRNREASGVLVFAAFASSKGR